MSHISVLLQPSIEGLLLKKGDVFVDGTLGEGGHSSYVCNLYGDNVLVVGIDRDKDAIEKAGLRIGDKCNAKLVLGNFRSIDKILASLSLKSADKILLDLGWNSGQIDHSGRGFSFQVDEPLIMTYEKDVLPDRLTAFTIVNFWDEENISTILWSYGEERFSRKIAQKIVEYREEKPIETTFDLVEIVKSAVPSFYRNRRIHPATKTFQALRIAVNEELQSLSEGLSKGFEYLSKNGRMAVISFHSMEDRIVKRFFREMKDLGKANIVTKRPIVPSKMEINENPRARSAKLRIVEKI